MRWLSTLLMLGVAQAAPFPAPTQSMPLLGGHITAPFPKGAKDEPRGRSIMAAARATVEESRIVFDHGDQRLVVMVYELFANSGSLEADVLAVHQDTPRADISLHADGKLLFLKASPKDLTVEAVPVATAYHHHADKSVQVVRFYVNPKGAAHLADYLALTRAIATQIGSGPAFAATASPAKLEVAGNRSLTLALPAGARITTRHGPDFFVFKVRTMQPITRNEGLMIYVGGHPSAVYARVAKQPDAPKPTAQPGTLFGKPVSWTRWAKGGLHWAELLHPHGDRDQLHLIVTADDEARLKALVDVAQGLAVQ